MHRLLLAGLLFLTACAGPVITGRRAYILSDSQLLEVTAQAEAGDTDAIWKMVNHYDARDSAQSRKKARKWALRGQALGDQNCRQWLWRNFAEDPSFDRNSL
jgi:hypothetical protein